MNKLETWKTRFFTIWIGQQISLFGSAIAQFALIWWLTQWTGSATVLATASLVAILPQVLLGCPSFWPFCFGAGGWKFGTYSW